MVRKRSLPPCKKLMARGPSAPTTLPAFCNSNKAGVRYSHRCVCASRNSTNWPPIRCRWLPTTLSFCNPERKPMTPLHEKLTQLNLTTMGRQLDQMIADAASKNMSFAQALELLTDFELEARNGRAIERRFRMSRLHSQHSIDGFQFKHHKSRMDAKNRIMRLLDL